MQGGDGITVFALAILEEYVPYSRFFSLVKYFVSQILAGSNFRH